MTIKSDYWNIEYLAAISAKVTFDRPVTKEDAIDLFKAGDFDDILDSDELYIDKVFENETSDIGGTDETDDVDDE